MFLQKRKEIADLAKQLRAECKKEFKSKPKTELAEANKTDWFLKICGVGIILLGLYKIDQHPAYAVIFIIIGIAVCFAAHDTPSPED